MPVDAGKGGTLPDGGRMGMKLDHVRNMDYGNPPSSGSSRPHLAVGSLAGPTCPFFQPLQVASHGFWLLFLIMM